MKFDAYVKLILTIIAVCLTWICVRDINVTPSAHAQAPVSPFEIKTYRLIWNLQNNLGTVELTRADNRVIPVQIKHPEEFAGWAAILNKKPISLDANGVLATGPVQTGTVPTGQ